MACSRTSLRSTAMTRLAGQVCLAAIEIDPPIRPRPTMAIFSKMGGCPCGRDGAIGSRRSSDMAMKDQTMGHKGHKSSATKVTKITKGSARKGHEDHEGL